MLVTKRLKNKIIEAITKKLSLKFIKLQIYKY